MSSRNTIIVAALGITLLATLCYALVNWGDEGSGPIANQAPPRQRTTATQPARPSTTEHGILDRRVRGPDGRPIRIGDLHPSREEEQDVVPESIVQVREGTVQSEAERRWDAMSADQRRALAREAVAHALDADAADGARANAAELLAVARADFFTSAEGQAEFIDLERAIGD
ncbi:MAG TPA: hypothetical protein VK034_10135 [Enhygromyxa sp.]|nr:hypothetical protein [Enhygromyxa sp.]